LTAGNRLTGYTVNKKISPTKGLLGLPLFSTKMLDPKLTIDKRMLKNHFEEKLNRPVLPAKVLEI